MSGMPEKCFTQVGSDLSQKHETMLEKLSRDKHSSFLEYSLVMYVQSLKTLPQSFKDEEK
jgi:hypothetical protein